MGALHVSTSFRHAIIAMILDLGSLWLLWRGCLNLMRVPLISHVIVVLDSLANTPMVQHR
jgi:hypothetical protein